jgi:hypothetical protein
MHVYIERDPPVSFEDGMPIYLSNIFDTVEAERYLIPRDNGTVAEHKPIEDQLFFLGGIIGGYSGCV